MMIRVGARELTRINFMIWKAPASSKGKLQGEVDSKRVWGPISEIEYRAWKGAWSESWVQEEGWSTLKCPKWPGNEGFGIERKVGRTECWARPILRTREEWRACKASVWKRVVGHENTGAVVKTWKSIHWESTPFHDWSRPWDYDWHFKDW